ncbi:MAG: DUF2141 domain-containing protein [Spirochaetaceae bacterium]|jgi:uncharacterized protein (DUF2141 family)|nr:DUF2141 domain-containing protein [Spirochaetaceae bacterium]
MKDALKIRKKFVLLWALLLWGVSNVCADIPSVIEIQEVRVQGGTLYVAVYADEASYTNNEPHSTFRLDPARPVLFINLNLPAGDYVVTAFQDTNGNGQLDTGIFGAPKEPAAKSNWNGIGSPGPWRKLKTAVNDSSRRITLCLYKLL